MVNLLTKVIRNIKEEHFEVIYNDKSKEVDWYRGHHLNFTYFTLILFAAIIGLRLRLDWGNHHYFIILLTIFTFLIGIISLIFNMHIYLNGEKNKKIKRGLEERFLYDDNQNKPTLKDYFENGLNKTIRGLIDPSFRLIIVLSWIFTLYFLISFN